MSDTIATVMADQVIAAHDLIEEETAA